MKIAGSYSLKQGEQKIAEGYPSLLAEVKQCIETVDVGHLRGSVSKQLTFNPSAISKSFKQEFRHRNWQPLRANNFRHMDFVKGKLGVEIEFGKPVAMIYSGCAKMTIFHNLGYIDCGIEIVPVKAFAEEMSSRVSYFEQFIWDLEHRGVSDIDIPMMIIGIDS